MLPVHRLLHHATMTSASKDEDAELFRPDVARHPYGQAITMEEGDLELISMMPPATYIIKPSG